MVEQLRHALGEREIILPSEYIIIDICFFVFISVSVVQESRYSNSIADIAKKITPSELPTFWSTGQLFEIREVKSTLFVLLATSRSDDFDTRGTE